MKPLFACLSLFFLLTFTANTFAQEVKQNPATAAKMTPKPVSSVSAAPKATPSSATKPAVRKVKKSENPARKTNKDGVFQDDFDGDVGIKYIGTEPASPEELARVKEVERTAKPVKASAKPTPTPVEKSKKMAETTPVEAKPAPVVAEYKPTPAAKPAVKTASKSSAHGARMEFEKTTIDLGNLKEDAVVERDFEFTNTGTSNLEILECRGSCGCIQPRAESTMIAPGEKSRIHVKYVARNKVGPQKPVVTLTTNASPSVMRLFIETWVDQIPGGVKDTTAAHSTAPKTR